MRLALWVSLGLAEVESGTRPNVSSRPSAAGSGSPGMTFSAGLLRGNPGYLGGPDGGSTRASPIGGDGARGEARGRVSGRLRRAKPGPLGRAAGSGQRRGL